MALLRRLTLSLLLLAIAATSLHAQTPAEVDWVPAIEHQQTGSERIRISTLSARNDMVTGGDVLVRVELDPTLDPDDLIVERNGTDVTSSFRPSGDSRRELLGLVTGLALGPNQLTVRTSGQQAELALTNHPRQGPVIYVPAEAPFFCATHLFERVTGETLADGTDANCSAPTQIDYVYRTTAGTIAPLPDRRAHPADVSYTTTTDGRRVPFIVRVETGIANRAIYELAMLHDPAAEAAPDPWRRSAGWNGRLIYRFGGGCRPGWYQQGTRTAGVIHDVELSRGYAIASSTLNVFANNCSELLSAETVMVVKERFVEAYGSPLFTIGWGSSGGAHQSHGVADNYPGLLDGLIVGSSFPDMTSGTSFKAVDSVLLQEYFDSTAPGLFTEEQQRAVSGFGVRASIPHLAIYALRADPDAYFADVVPESARYHPTRNPGGARATIYDHTVNVYGRDTATGFARRPLDNVGVQYGLSALNDGVITVEQFLDLNERIGGLDIDFEHQAERTVADPAAARAAYRTGRIISGHGLASVPIIDYRAYLDLAENGDNHMKLHSFSMRERLRRANGHADNHVVLVRDRRFRSGFGSGYSSDASNDVLYEALAQMDGWLTAVVADSSNASLREKVVRARPADLVDACWAPDGRKITEEQTYDGPGECGRLYPSFPVPAMVAGAPLVDDIVKCHLKPIDARDYQVPFTPEQRARLERIFGEGVCDWSRPGVGQEPPVGLWLRAIPR